MKWLLVLLTLIMITGVVEAKGPVVVTTFTILEDFAKQVAGDDAHVRNIVPIGAEVHEWELTPRNFIDLETADIVFYNGFNMEQWMSQVRATVGRGVPVVALKEETEYTPLPIIIGDYTGDWDPHIWMDVRGAISYVKVISDYLQSIHPEAAKNYARNAQAYIDKLEEFHGEITEKLSVLQKDERVLITSEAAFIYFAHAYDFFHDGIWGTNTEEEGTPQQLARIIDIIGEKKPKVLFWESTISDRYVKGVAEDTKMEIAGPLYVDSTDFDLPTYIDIIRHNVNLLLEVLRS